MEKRLYRLTMVIYRDLRNTDTDYIKDFETLESAIAYTKRNKQELTQESLCYDDSVAVDIEIEEWDNDDNIKVVWSTELWHKEDREKHFVEEIKKTFKEHHINDCDTLCKIYDHRHEMFEDSNIIYYFEKACEEYAIEKDWKIEFGLHLGLNKIGGKNDD